MSQFVQERVQFKNFTFEPYRPEFMEECLDVLEQSYYTLNPIYIGLKMSRADFREFQKPSFLDERCWKYSYVVLDNQQNNKMVGMQIIKDVAHMSAQPETHGDPKKDFKEDLDNQLYSPVLEQNYKVGECATIALWCVDPRSVKGGLGYAMLQNVCRNVYRFNFKVLVNIIYNLSSLRLAMTFGGEVAKKIILNDLELEGEKIYADNKDQGQLHTISVDDELFFKASKNYKYTEEQFMKIKRTYRINEDMTQYQLKNPNNNNEIIKIQPKL